MGRLLARLLLIVAMLAGAAFVAAPGVAFFSLRSAADAGDAEALSLLIDAAALRRSLAPQLAGTATGEAVRPGFIQDPVGSLRRMVEQATAPAGPDPDAYLTAPALSALTRGEGRFAALRSGAPDAQDRPNLFDGPWPAPRYWSPSRARLAVIDEGGAETLFTFERSGVYRWKLSHVSLPAGAGPDAAPPAVQTGR